VQSLSERLGPTGIRAPDRPALPQPLRHYATPTHGHALRYAAMIYVDINQNVTYGIMLLGNVRRCQ
jgi:hypothetical protein